MSLLLFYVEFVFLQVNSEREGELELTCSGDGGCNRASSHSSDRD